MGHPRHARRGAEPPAPTARQTFVRMLPTCAMLVFGSPTAALVVQGGAGQEDRSSWAPLLYLSVVALTLIVYRFTRAPRPRQDIEVDGAQRRRALTAASQIGKVPTDPAVRKSTGVLACERIEMFAMMVAALTGVIAGMVIHPVPGWGVVWGPILVGSIAGVFRLRSSITYLRALHLEPRPTNASRERMPRVQAFGTPGIPLWASTRLHTSHRRIPDFNTRDVVCPSH